MGRLNLWVSLSDMVRDWRKGWRWMWRMGMGAGPVLRRPLGAKEDGLLRLVSILVLW
jgi:hypothetical protein